MREIKFRAWGATERSDWEDEMQYDFDIESVDGEIFCMGEAQPEWVLMQYTGLKDKNGMEIYEGDIVRVSPQNPVLMEVVWTDDFGRFELKHISPPNDFYGISRAKHYEVIGNIYEDSHYNNL